MKSGILFLCLAFFVPHLRGQVWQLFETETVPAGWGVSGLGGSIQIVSSRSWQGERSLEWKWMQSPGALEWAISPASSGTGHRVFSQWVRLETPMPDARLRVELRSTDNNVRHFEMNLDFTGWRTVFVPYSSMSGSGTNNINQVRWTFAGTPPPSGALYLDQVIVGQSMDMRFQFADRQVPFVWEERAKTMWENLPHWHRSRPSSVVATAAEIQSVRQLRAEWDSRLVGTGTVTASTVDRWEERLDAFQVRREEGRVRGNPIFTRQYPGLAYPPALAAQLEGAQAPNQFQDFSILMLDLARGWHRTENPVLRERIGGMLLLMAEHLLDQGWASGSNQGALFIFGYQSREYMRAVYLAREVFADAGILEEMGEAARWYGQAGSLLDEPRPPNMDFFNTLLQGQMLAILMEPDEEMQVAWMRAFSESLTDQLTNVTPGDVNGFKPDGTTFHHNGHYPAYGIGAIHTIGDVFDVLRGGAFELGDEARLSFRTVLLAARAYSNPLDWPTGIAGRHPFSGSIGNARNAMLALARYADPVVGTAPDRECAAAYVRLWGMPGGAAGELFAKAGIQAEAATGFFTFPFANHAVYRAEDWMVSMKGYSRYVWSSEIYAADNRYGRNQSNGTAEILLGSGRTASGFREAGWDWNRLPGTTALHLPLAELESPNAGTLMLRSSETMAGGVTAGESGAFGFILNENRFGHRLQARKSYFAAEGLIVALGSGIGSDHATAPVETTLFQVALTGGVPPIHLSTSPGAPISAFPWTADFDPETPFWVLDPVGNGFWVPAGQQLRFSRVAQQSRHNKTKAVTSGNFASGWIDHGVGADGGRYEYAILPKRSLGEMTEFSNRMVSAAPAYEVLHHDDTLHAVRIGESGRRGFVIFEPGNWGNLPYLLEADRQSLLWIEEVESGIVLSMANPDLNPGVEENLVSPMSFLLKGLWKPSDDHGDLLVFHENGNTRIFVPAREGATRQLRLAAVSSELPWPQESFSGDLAPVKNFRIEVPGARFLTWDRSDELIHGYVIERMLPGENEFFPVAFLDKTTERFSNGTLPGMLAHYRIRKWDDLGLGEATPPVLVFDSGTESVAYDFRAVTDVDDLLGDGWSSAGLQSESDWYLDPRGMFLFDNSPSHPATLTVPFSQRPSGRISARMGVAGTANFQARIELFGGSRSLGMIELQTRTRGYLRGPEDVEFHDDNWDIFQGGSPRDLLIEWREIPGTDRMEIFLRFLGTTEEASAVNRWEIVKDGSNQPDRIRFSTGFGSAVNRGLFLESLEIVTHSPYSRADFFRAWAAAFLEDADADPVEDTDGNGIANLWEFAWSQRTSAPASRIRSDLVPKVFGEDENLRFAWEIPVLDGMELRLEGTDQLGEPWTVLPHQLEPLPGKPGWARLIAPPAGQGSARSFYRLVLTVDWDE